MWNWLFGSKELPQQQQQPADYVSGNFRASYDIAEELWKFQLAGIPFGVRGTGKEFDLRELEWAENTARLIQTIRPDIEAKVDEQLSGWFGACDPAAKRINLVTRLNYPDGKDRTLVNYTGDKSWGDYVATVVILDLKVIDSYGSN
ncbi:MAG: hypothetical protein ACAI35_10065 [Candidatus Methylacidiphilales bacterium]